MVNLNVINAVGKEIVRSKGDQRMRNGGRELQVYIGWSV